jgi:hypothetical protein
MGGHPPKPRLARVPVGCLRSRCWPTVSARVGSALLHATLCCLCSSFSCCPRRLGLNLDHRKIQAGEAHVGNPSSANPRSQSLQPLGISRCLFLLLLITLLLALLGSGHLFFSFSFFGAGSDRGSEPFSIYTWLYRRAPGTLDRRALSCRPLPALCQTNIIIRVRS